MGRYDLHLREDEFWDLTLKQFNALINRWNSDHDWLNYRAGVISATIANVNSDPKKRRRPWTPDDFFPTHQKKEQTPEQILANIEMLNAAYDGKVKEN